MSTLALTPGKKLGELVTLPYNGNLFTAADGTVWKAANLKPLAYDSSYAQLAAAAPNCITSAVLLPGPFTGGTWQGFVGQHIVGAVNGTWLTMPRGAVVASYYYTSTDQGQTWTQRTCPVAAKSWIALWDGTNFVIYASLTTSTGVQESTDGINWTARTAISLTPDKLIWNGSVYLAAAGGTTCATSSDRTTWTSRTCTTPASNTLSTLGDLGWITWNAGASLFVMGTSTAGQYQTSPDGVTWTNRTTLNAIPAFTDANIGTLYASSSTITIAVGTLGMIAYSTDCVNWTVVNVDSNFDAGGKPAAVYYDGSRFVVYFQGGGTYGIAYYSTNGSSWTKAQFCHFGGSTGSIGTCPLGIITAASSANLRYVVADITSTTKNNILHTSTGIDAITRAYFRVK